MLADRIGAMNAFIVCMGIAALTVFVIWMFSYNLATLMLFCVLHGLVYQCYFSVSKFYRLVIQIIANNPKIN